MKTFFLAKPGSLLRATSIFADTNIKVVQDDMKYLGGAIGSRSFLTTVLLAEVQLWSEKIDKLIGIAKSEPDAAFATFTRGVSASWQHFV